MLSLNNLISLMKPLKTAALTIREKQVLKLVAEGCSRQQIAEALYISSETVKSHIKNIYRKLEVGGKLDAVRKMGYL